MNSSDLVSRMLSGDRLALSRLISHVESRSSDLVSLMARVQEKCGRAFCIGFTGPPGAGKSTLVDRMIAHLRAKGKKVGVIAIDPSSPFSGGAVLGDRIRMQDHTGDEGVFIRSLGSRGSHGGLSRAAQEVVKLYDAFGMDYVLVETVGVGQTELDIMEIAETTVVILTPESGDAVQTLKAGILEIADIFVVNKADRDGSYLMQAELKSMLELGAKRDSWAAPVLLVQANKDVGVVDLMQAVEDHKIYLRQKGGAGERKKKILKSINPATGEILADIQTTSEEEVRKAVERARTAAWSWGKLSYRERAVFILKAREYIRTHLDEIASLITRENGKPLTESVSADLFPVMDLATYFAKNAEKILRREKIWLGKWSLMGRMSYLEYQPVGVLGIISPWNFPFSIPCGQAMMALLAGNAVVLKPSEFTPLIGLKIQEIFDAVGLPKGVLQVIPGDATTGASLVQSGVNKILFTGSVPTGKKIMEAAAKTLTPVILELGGKDPMIVLEDADLDISSSAAVWGAFSNSGQVCASVERLYVHHEIAEPFLKKCVEKINQLTQGDGLKPDMELGAMTMEPQLLKVEQQVEEAKQQGAKALTGGQRKAGTKGLFYPPTLMTNVTHDMSVMKEESFGPVVGMMTFRSDDEAVRLANDSRYGLTASVWTRNLQRGMKMARAIEAGTVSINENVYTYALAQTPWGGPKESGIGRTHGKLGLLEMVDVKHIHVNYVARIKDFWWYGYDQAKYSLMTSLADTLFGNGVFQRVKAGLKFLWLQFRIRNL